MDPILMFASGSASACSCGCGCASGCGELSTRFPIQNPSGLRQIAYRVGNFASFRRALLGHLPDESELDIWRPTAGSDLGMQVLDWWAYIADILTFYNERIANEDYLSTAQSPTSVTHLVSLLGYRPRPGIGATATLAVIAAGPGPLTIPAGLAIASKATPALESQTFETSHALTLLAPTSVLGPTPDDLTSSPPLTGPPAAAAPGVAEPPPHNQLIARGGVLVKGVPTSIAVSDRLVLLHKTWNSADDPAAVVTVTGLVTEKDPHGRKNTRVLLSGTSSLSSAVAADFRLVRASRTGHLSSLPSGATVITSTSLVLDAPARYLKASDPLLLELPGAGVGVSPGSGFDLVRLSAYAEVLWYANAPNAAAPTTPPSGSTPGIPLMVSTLTVAGHSGSNLAAYSGQVHNLAIQAGWNDVGVLLDTPVATLTTLPATVTLGRPPTAKAGVATAALLEDAQGNGVGVTATATTGSSDISIAAADPGSTVPTLQAPLRILWDLIVVSRGSTVHDELLGIGDATSAGQDFALSKVGVTFLSEAPGRSGDGYSSTIVLSVDGRYWTEVPMLYGHGPAESIFETYADDAGKTHVRFGDGTAGRRLPSGAKVSATYRVGSGGAAPAPGALSQVLSAVPNLRSVRNPVAPVGGADSEPASDIRRLAPRSVLTFGRAISGDDYAAVAAAAPAVVRASSSWEWDAVEQRPMVRVYVGDDAGALASARSALAAQADPNRPLVVVPAVKCVAGLILVLRLDPTYVSGEVQKAVASVLVDEPAGLFAPGVLSLGEPLYRSRIEEVVCAVPGVLTTHKMRMIWFRNWVLHSSTGPRFNPGDGGYFTMAAENLFLSHEVDADD
jgi:hypothetical protein